MRKSKKGLVPGLACGLGIVSATTLVVGVAASGYTGTNVISEDTTLSGVNFNSSGDSEAALIAVDGSSSLTSAMIVASGANSMSAVLQNNASLSFVGSTVINSGLQGTAFLMDNSFGDLSISSSSVSATGNLLAVQNSNASLSLIGNSSANGSILVDGASILRISMTGGNQFIGNINNFNVIYLLSGGDPTPVGYTAGKTDLLVTWLYKLTVDQQYYNWGAVIGILTFIVLAVVSLVTYQNSNSYKDEEGFM